MFSTNLDFSAMKFETAKLSATMSFPFFSSFRPRDFLQLRETRVLCHVSTPHSRPNKTQNAEGRSFFRLGFACSMLGKSKNIFSQMVVKNGDLPW